MKNTKNIIATVLAGVLWGLISLFLKPLSASGLDSIQVNIIRCWFSALFLFFVLLVKDRNLLKIELKDWWMFVGTGVISLTFFSFCYFKTIIDLGASIAVVLLYTSPIIVLVLSAIIFKEKITFVKVIAIVLTFAGCILVAGVLGGSHTVSIKGFIIGLGAGLGYALYSIFSRFALKKYNPITITFYTILFSSISLIPFFKVQTLYSFSNGNNFLLALGLSILCTVLPYIFYTYGLSNLENSKAAILVTVEPLVGTLIGFFVWGENKSFVKILGIGLIIVSIILCSLKGNTKQQE